MFRQLRILALLLVLLVVALSTWLTQLRTTDWDRPLVVAIYPINADGSDTVERYISQLTTATFADIDTFFADEAAHYQLSITEPVNIVLADRLTEQPPTPPADRNPLKTMWWSLKMRYWAKRIAIKHGPSADIQMFVRYHAPDQQKKLRHSLGLQKGLLGVVNAFASRRQNASNNLVIAHETLHTVGASDKYHPVTLQPLYPAGYAEPERTPLLPQRYAEIMAGRIPLSETEKKPTGSLTSAVVGEITAHEIRWLP